MSPLTNELFECLIQTNYPQNIYLYERRLHIQKIRVMQALNNYRMFIYCMRPYIHIEEKNHLDSILQDVEMTYNMLLDLAQIRRRVTDHATFLLCAKELDHVRRAIQAILCSLLDAKRNVLQNVQNDLGMSIIKFEEVFFQVVEVSAKEPSAFLFFLNTLKRLNRRLITLQEYLLNLDIVHKDKEYKNNEN